LAAGRRLGVAFLAAGFLADGFLAAGFLAAAERRRRTPPTCSWYRPAGSS